MVGTLVRGCRCPMSWCDLDFTFDLAVVTLTYKILSGLYLGNFLLYFFINAVILLLNCLVLTLSLHFPRLWGTGISDAILYTIIILVSCFWLLFPYSYKEFIYFCLMSSSAILHVEYFV